VLLSTANIDIQSVLQLVANDESESQLKTHSFLYELVYFKQNLQNGSIKHLSVIQIHFPSAVGHAICMYMC